MIRLLRDRLAQAGVGDQIFEQLQQQLSLQDYFARCGRIIDASNTTRNVHAGRGDPCIER